MRYHVLSQLYCGLKQESILYGLQHLTMTKMRMQLVKANGYMILDDSYKSNPESAKAAIDALESLPVSFRIACLADMLDLGPTEKISICKLANMPRLRI